MQSVSNLKTVMGYALQILDTGKHFNFLEPEFYI